MKGRKKREVDGDGVEEVVTSGTHNTVPMTDM
jgi:hypothetical protein